MARQAREPINRKLPITPAMTADDRSRARRGGDPLSVVPIGETRAHLIGGLLIAPDELIDGNLPCLGQAGEDDDGRVKGAAFNAANGGPMQA